MNQENGVFERQKSKAALSDDAIIELYWKREEKAIKETDVKYGRYLFTVAYNIVHDRLDCEECLNDTYLGTWNSIPPARPSVFNVFLSRITRNLAVDRYKMSTALKRVPTELTLSMEDLEDCVPDGALSMEEAYALSALKEIMKRFIATLDEREEFIFVCRYYYADRISLIAKMLQISEKTVSRELSRMKSALKEQLQKGGFTYE